MAFYYWSLLSAIPLGIAYGVLALMFWWIVWITSDSPRRLATRVIAAFVLLLIPVSEELWIAWNFARACESAGTFIDKKVVVEGFYDDTTAWGARQLSESGYRFAESRDNLNRRFLRVEHADSAARERALSWYASTNPAKEKPHQEFFTYELNERERLVVAHNGTDAWRVTSIDHPTARYSYIQPHNHTRVAHNVDRNERQVIDSGRKEVLAREINFARDAPWFYVGLDRPLRICHGRHDPELRGSIYTHVLLPSKEGR